MRVRNTTRGCVTEAAVSELCQDDAHAEGGGHALRSSPVDQERIRFELEISHVTSIFQQAGDLGNDATLECCIDGVRQPFSSSQISARST